MRRPEKLRLPRVMVRLIEIWGAKPWTWQHVVLAALLAATPYVPFQELDAHVAQAPLSLPGHTVAVIESGSPDAGRLSHSHPSIEGPSNVSPSRPTSAATLTIPRAATASVTGVARINLPCMLPRGNIGPGARHAVAATAEPS